MLFNRYQNFSINSYFEQNLLQKKSFFLVYTIEKHALYQVHMKFQSSTCSTYQFLAHEMIGACAIIIWGAATSSAMFGTLKLIGKLRVSEVEERKGKIISQPNPIYKFWQPEQLWGPISPRSSGLRGAGARTWTDHISIYFQSYECVELYLHSPTCLRGIVLG